ncbi:MAG TPA: hypothetical protein DCR46_07410 [Cytophagales bacterium]|nr:hypothetical protein [Cytophagales bacterium]
MQDPLGQTIGRVAAFINNKTAKSTYVVCGGMGFFECTNNQEAAFLLFDTCRKWLEERGMKAMEGPINFGERDKWWGLLVQGFDHEPNYCMPYTLPYYRNFFENYGFREYFRQFTYHRPVETPLPQIYFEKAERIARDPRYRFEHIKKKHLKKYTQDFQLVYNAAWTKHAGVKGMSNAQAFNIMQQLKPILDEEIVWFAYHDTLPIGFFIMIPELNQLFKHCNGKFGIWQKLIFLYHKWRGTCTKMYGVAFGIIPQFQGKGLEGAIVQAAANILQKNPKYTDFEMNWIGDFNPKMMHVAESVGGNICKIHITYRFMFDPNIPFERAPTIR